MRTKNSVKNIISVLVFNLIIGVLGFVKVRVFINGLSNDIYSLNQLFYQIFSYIAIADIGFGLIINQKLYAAFSKDDYEEVNKIYSTSKKFYKYIGLLMLGIALILSFFVQYLTKANVSPYYIQVIFILFILRNVIDYFFVAPRFVLEAGQKLYKINYLVKAIKIVELIIEMILVTVGVDYIAVLIPGILLTIGFDIYINKKIAKIYPWLEDIHKFDKNHLKGTKDVIYQKLSGLLNSNTDIILISTFINPISVIIYTSYNYITKYITDTIYMVASAITPSYANVINKEEKEKSFSVFNEMNILFLFLATFVCVMLYGFLNPLITFWVGSEYVVSKWLLVLFCLVAFQIIAERAFIIIINSKGLFKETRTIVIVEAIINFGLSILLVNKIGIAGVLLGTVISKFISSTIVKSRYIYKQVFNHNSIGYFLNYGLVIIINVLFILAFNFLNLKIESVLIWIIYVLVSSIIVLIILLIAFFVLFKSFRNLLNRGKMFIKTKKNIS